VSAMRQPLTWIAVALMLTGAILLVTDVGAAGLWIAVITIGIALVGIEAYRNRQEHHHA
jgi:membrane-bound ClpP family serine protease